jgi:hypothetical protein
MPQRLWRVQSASYRLSPSFIFLHWRWRQNFAPEHQLILTDYIALYLIRLNCLLMLKAVKVKSEDKTLLNTNSKAKLCNMPRRPMGLWDVEAPTLSRQMARTWRSRSIPPPPRKFLLLISVRATHLDYIAWNGMMNNEFWIRKGSKGNCLCQIDVLL